MQAVRMFMHALATAWSRSIHFLARASLHDAACTLTPAEQKGTTLLRGHAGGRVESGACYSGAGRAPSTAAIAVADPLPTPLPTPTLPLITCNAPREPHQGSL